MSSIYVSLMAVEISGGATLAPVPLARKIGTNQVMAGSTTAAKSTVTTSYAAIEAVLGNDWTSRFRVVWSITIVGSDFVHLIFGKSLTAANYNTGNAAASSFVRGQNTWEFGIDGYDQELVVLHTA